MTLNSILSSYEELLTETEDVMESLVLLQSWLQKKPSFDDYRSYYDLIACHSSYLALLNLIMYRLDSLSKEHHTILEAQLQKGN